MNGSIENTGEIASLQLDAAQDYGAADQEIDFTDEQHAIWADLYAGVYQPQFLDFMCREFKVGLRRIEYDARHIPTLAHLNSKITPRTGWTIERTAVRYTDADNWYDKFAKRIFLVTDYLRTRDQLEFTPEPDMFHDIFGHLPYLTQRFYANIENRFAPAYLKATSEERDVIKRLAWYSTEFGLVIEDDEIKIFGAGLLSGKCEMTKVINEIERLNRDLLTSDEGVYDQLCSVYESHRLQVGNLIAEINLLHEKGQMSSAEKGWSVINQIYERLGIPRDGYFGGEVVIAPFDLSTIATVPKTVYAINPIFFVSESFDSMDAVLDGYLTPISQR
ncbi:MAG: hypothetical protein ACK2T3_16340 [Candidatus Promineifilaceae bacterium]